MDPFLVALVVISFNLDGHESTTFFFSFACLVTPQVMLLIKARELESAF